MEWGLEWFIQKMAARCSLCLTFALGRYSDQMRSFRAASGWLSFHKLTDFFKGGVLENINLNPCVLLLSCYERHLEKRPQMRDVQPSAKRLICT